MTETVDIVAFIEARDRETEWLAREAASDAGPHWTEPSSGLVETADDMIVTGDARVSRHIVGHDPARVLADIAGRRVILAQHHRVEWDGPAGCGTCSTDGVELVPWPCLTVRALAVSYAGHPDHYSGWGLDGAS